HPPRPARSLHDALPIFDLADAGDPAFLDHVDRHLRDAGLTPSASSSKLARALTTTAPAATAPRSPAAAAPAPAPSPAAAPKKKRSEEHTSELQSRENLV